MQVGLAWNDVCMAHAHVSTQMRMLSHATCSGTVCRVITFVNAREDAKCKITPQRPSDRPVAYFGKGVGGLRDPCADAHTSASGVCCLCS